MTFKKSLLTLISLSKRQKFILTALVLSAGLLLIQIVNLSWHYQAIGLLALLSYSLSAWSLKEGLNGIEWLTVLTLPFLLTVGTGLFYFLLPSGWLANILGVAAFGLVMYVLLLTENIFSVAAIRTIQLIRAAHAVGFLLTLVTAFFLYDTIFSFRFDFWVNFVLVGLVSFPLLLSGLWSINLEGKITKKNWLYALCLSLLLAQLALAFSFWPVSVASGSLFLVTAMYVILGLSQLEFSEQLFKRSVYEYISVGITILLVMILTTKWRG